MINKPFEHQPRTIGQKTKLVQAQPRIPHINHLKIGFTREEVRRLEANKRID